MESVGEAPRALKLALNVAGHSRGVSSVAFAHDCVHLALAAKDGAWSVVKTDVRYDLKVEAKEHARGAAPGKPFDLVALSPFATRLVGACASSVTIVDVAAAARGRGGTLSVVDTMPTMHAGVSALQFSGDGLRVLSGGADGKLRLWRVAEDEKAGTV